MMVIVLGDVTGLHPHIVGEWLYGICTVDSVFKGEVMLGGFLKPQNSISYSSCSLLMYCALQPRHLLNSPSVSVLHVVENHGMSAGFPC